METKKESKAVRETKKIMRKAIIGYAGLCEILPEKIWIVISSQPETDFKPKFDILPDNKVDSMFEVDFSGLYMGGKRDLLGLSKLAEMMALPYFKSAMESACSDFNIDKNNLKIIISTNDENAENIFIHIFDQFKFVKQIDFDYIFGDEEDQED